MCRAVRTFALRRLMNFCVPFQVTAETDQPRVSTPSSQVTSSSPGVGAALAALGGLGGIFGNHLQMLGSLQAFQNPQSLQQLQQLAMLQQASGNQINPQTQFFLQNQVSTHVHIFIGPKKNCNLLSKRVCCLRLNNMCVCFL